MQTLTTDMSQDAPDGDTRNAGTAATVGRSVRIALARGWPEPTNPKATPVFRLGAGLDTLRNNFV